ncbi:MAG: hypothetical protein DRJ67_10645 [Thermoprotei archaeon]|nr:MAG: hypothetical protein DRJ67_10645 [Thermoprotei archaeon]
MRYPRVDLHVHTTYSDGRSPIEDVVRAAEANELEGLAITDHVYDPSQRVEWLEKAAEELSRAEPRIGVVLGVEVTKVGLSGLSIGEWLRRRAGIIVCEHPVPARARCLREYLELVLRGVELVVTTPGVDVLAHPLNLGRAGVVEDFRVLGREFLDEVARLVAGAGVAVEVMSQMYWWYPRMSITAFTDAYVEFIRLCKHHGASFSIGSDAHSACGVGNTRWALKVLERAGVTCDEIWLPEPLR